MSHCSREFGYTADVFYFESSAYCQVDNANEEVSNKLPGRHLTMASCFNLHNKWSKCFA